MLESSAESNAFDLNRGTWINISPLPTISCRCSATFYEDIIIIVGENINGVLKYKEESNCYERLLNCTSFDKDSENSEHKKVFQKWLFIRGKDYVWEIERGKFIRYPMKNEWTIFELQSSCEFKKGKYLFFVEHSLSIPTVLRYDTELRALVKV